MLWIFLIIVAIILGLGFLSFLLVKLVIIALLASALFVYVTCYIFANAILGSNSTEISWVASIVFGTIINIILVKFLVNEDYARNKSKAKLSARESKSFVMPDGMISNFEPASNRKNYSEKQLQGTNKHKSGWIWPISIWRSASRKQFQTTCESKSGLKQPRKTNAEAKAERRRKHEEMQALIKFYADQNRKNKEKT